MTAKKDVVLLTFIERLHQHESWCGETHIQKGTYFLQELLGVPLDFRFILYKHGPYSFDLKDELTAQVADALLAVKSREPYGPNLVLGENSAALLERSPRSRAAYRTQAEFVASRLGSKTVAELERLATALYVLRTALPNGTAEERTEKLRALKPHLTEPQAHDAVAEVDRLAADAEDHRVHAPELEPVA